MLMFYTNPILITAAVLPAVILMIYVYKADKLDREPPRLLISLVIYGVISTVLAKAAERLGLSILTISGINNELVYNAVFYFVVVGFSEEGAKYLLLKRRTWYSQDFNCQFDAVVYAVFVSLGFALWENIGYVAMYGFSTAIVRAVTAVPGHACFGVFMGAWYGAAKRYDYSGEDSRSTLCRRLAFLLPAFAHGCYDFAASLENQNYAWIFYAFIVIMFVSAFVTVRKMSRTDRYI